MSVPVCRHEPSEPPEAGHEQVVAPADQELCPPAVRRGGRRLRHDVERAAHGACRPHGRRLRRRPGVQDGHERHQERLRGGEAAGAPRRGLAGHGLLLLQLGIHCDSAAATATRCQEDSHRRLGEASARLTCVPKIYK